VGPRVVDIAEIICEIPRLALCDTTASEYATSDKHKVTTERRSV
jgi:hypothetical protein